MKSLFLGLSIHTDRHIKIKRLDIRINDDIQKCIFIDMEVQPDKNHLLKNMKKKI